MDALQKERFVTEAEAEALRALKAQGQKMISILDLWHILGQRITTVSINYWLKNGFIDGAIQVGGRHKWMIPIDGVLAMEDPATQRLNEDYVREIRARKEAGEDLKSVQADYAFVHPNTVSAVWTGRTWKDVK